jgi:hypothetical protein
LNPPGKADIKLNAKGKEALQAIRWPLQLVLVALAILLVAIALK